ncbi:heme ABC transporter ATP-binding protein CcmA [Sphingomonas panacis]|uniref:Heme ABC transporter ATP-binding protein CcmA n=1 Tax=Sphingomonas panacis TaxID=1560345 RepID=A0A1B3Z6M7_9SPHN|nr:heme ABC exporter ATP-binding protein CcmA [Sphingomonas panacis]AOH83084.1 heme ABC transporter ATP-binding protein CcmA [Sphingomonas panacis]
MADPDQPPRLAFHGVTGVRGGRRLFAGLSFTLAPGDAALVTGANGVGKSTLLRIAAGLLAPAEGRVETPRCALMAEAAALDSGQTLEDALRFWAALDAAPEPARRVTDAMTATGLAALAHVPVRLLSTGQRRRAALARVVASEAPLWLLDEPVNGLDAASVTTLETLVADHRARGGIALVATHTDIALPGALGIAL